MSRVGKALSKQRGFSYAMVLAAIVIVGILVEAAYETTWHIVQSDREAELLFRGEAYRRAIQSFYQSNGTYPRQLEDLLKDPRSASRRHLRALYKDPLGREKKGEWTIVLGKDGGIAGVASTSGEEPLKRANFPKQFEKFAAAKSYKDWIFEYVPAVTPGLRPPIIPATPPTPPSLRTF